jgi:hypothetical protein
MDDPVGMSLGWCIFLSVFGGVDIVKVIPMEQLIVGWM